ncbi:MAG: cytochrome c3 family protein [Geobacteraceae bacterium]
MKSRFALFAVFVGLLPLVSFAKETKDIPFHFRNAEPVIFSHDVHLTKYSNNCKVCHNVIFNIRESRRFTMAEMEKTKSCGACHTGVKAFSVTHEKSCARCHKGKPRSITYKLKGSTTVVFSHDIHIAKTAGKCRNCHNGKVITGRKIKVSMAQMEKGESCGACHNGKKAFSVDGNCGNCHKGMKPPKELRFKSSKISDAVFSHTFHLEIMSNCKVCHTRIFPYKVGLKHTTMADMEKGKSCGTCHNGKDTFSVISNCDRCHKGFKPGIMTFKTDAGDAKFSHEFHLSMYKCQDCHTKIFPYKVGILRIGMEGMDGGKSCGACHNGKDAFSSKEDCAKCHNM